VLGGAREVGGSCISVDTDSCKVGLDYGTKLEEEIMKKFPRDFDAVVISHAHLDHTGSLLSLCKNKTRPSWVRTLHAM
jgi:Cft2 family RNA processing exonuclease